MNRKDKFKDTESPSPISFKTFKGTIILSVIIFLLLILSSISLFIVKENEYKIVRQFGEVVKIIDEPGLSFKLPFVQSTTTIPKNKMAHGIQTEEITTKDKKRILIDNYVVWKVNDPKLLINNAGTLVNAESRMEEFIYSVIRSELGVLNYDQIISDEESSRGSVNDVVTSKVNELLAKDNYGIEVVDVRIRRTDLPSDNEQSVYNRMISERQAIAQKYLSEGDADKRRIEADTDHQVVTILSEANREASSIIASGESEAAKIYNNSYSKDANFYELYRTLESYRTTFNDETVIMLPVNSEYVKYLTGK